MIYANESCCRSCLSTDLVDVVHFGVTPLADRLLTAEQLDDDDLAAPLTLVFCRSCSLVQIKETVDPEILFYSDYPYFSSVSPSLMKHFAESASNIAVRRRLGSDSLVVEAASNDGYMLRHFHDRGVRVLGIEPTDGPAAAAQRLGIETRTTFFTHSYAVRVREEFPQGAAVFLANNVLAHVPDLNGFVAGVATVLADDGLAVIEVPYLVDLIDHCEFDTIYHQHLCYFSVTALFQLFSRHGLSLNDVERTKIHGGSLRLFVEKSKNVSESTHSLIDQEAQRHVIQEEFYQDFGRQIAGIKKRLMELIEGLRAEGKSIAAYGAAAKANTLMAYCGIDSSHLSWVADKNEFKQERYYSGNHLPIVPPSRIGVERPDYLLILAWNFAEEIIAEQRVFAAGGGKFIVPIPDPHIR